MGTTTIIDTTTKGHHPVTIASCTTSDSAHACIRAPVRVSFPARAHVRDRLRAAGEVRASRCR
eukprot:6814484-Alexandrium_andersonii.AAC.1